VPSASHPRPFIAAVQAQLPIPARAALPAS
jgi:hypothetical protein